MTGTVTFRPEDCRAIQATRFACGLTTRLTARLYPGEPVTTRMGLGTFATYYRQPSPHYPDHHLFNYGSVLLARLIDIWDPRCPLETSGREMVRYGWDREYGPVTRACRIACLVAHEVCHMGVFLRYEHPKKPHGPEFKQLLCAVHQRGLVQEMITFLHSQEEDPWLARPLPRQEGVQPPAVRPADFSRGERVFFRDRRGKPLAGTITRVNRKSLTVQLDRDPPSRWWRVPPRLLERLENF